MSCSRIVVDALQVPAQFSGVGRQALAIGAGLADLPEGLELELRCPADTVELFRPAYPAATRLLAPIPRSRPRARRILYQQLAAPLLDPPSALVVCLGDQGPLWGRARRLLVVNDVRRLTDPFSSGGLEGAYYRALVPRAARRAASVVTISEFSRGELERELGIRARTVAHHPPPRADAPADPEGREGLLVVGALRPYKGVETVLEALAGIPSEDRPTVTFAGPGEGREAEFRARAVALGVAPSVRLAGWVPEAELERLYARSLATISPSTYEGYGLPLAESLARGVPALASDIPPHREIGAEAVPYFPPRDAPALADQLMRLPAEGSAYSALAARALERSRALAAARPTWRDVILEAAGWGAASP